jgi:glutathione synthase/RimK-type ligase-like ATP-grasp enzyme
MQRVLVLFDKQSVLNKQANPDAFISLLQSESTQSQYEYAYIEDFVCFIDENSTMHFISDDNKIIDLDGFNVIYFRRWGKVAAFARAIAIYAKHKGIVVVDSEVVGIGAMDKTNQMVRLWTEGVPVPKTAYCGSSQGAKAYLVKLLSQRDWGDKWIVKAALGTRGQDNFLVNSLEELSSIILERVETFVIQEFIPNNSDLRIWVLGGECVLVIERSRQEGHLNNTSMGAGARMLNTKEISETILATAIESAAVLSRQVAGVDIIINSITGDHFVLEVNRSPQLENSTYQPEKARVLNQYIEKLIKM